MTDQPRNLVPPLEGELVPVVDFRHRPFPKGETVLIWDDIRYCWYRVEGAWFHNRNGYLGISGEAGFMSPSLDGPWQPQSVIITEYQIMVGNVRCFVWLQPVTDPWEEKP